ncbi:putative inactive leucine-rich repeat receptor-like protein kinase [Capsicum annuum]|uniref:Inactive leucine-rich repeat receptor-like protein kinase n=1 Tax=Capsicum annuum TaxID=4072 RepID=A0A2G2YYQ1_CAPAN|nr:putative inactive leucine-rich repeat receptor-like protein kinase [Capsicum annuum]PHT74864.1 putative inactive leucine-rich repeat receptor-like protein kinase [Capsicum annuum]
MQLLQPHHFLEKPTKKIAMGIASTVQYSWWLVVFMVFLLFNLSHELLETSQYEAIVKIKQLLNFPEDLSSSSDNTDFCNSEPNTALTLMCYEDNVTQLHVSGYNWFPNLPQGFSTDTLFSNLALLPNLKVLSLVSLGLRGTLPKQIGYLSSLEIVNVSSNLFYGEIPGEIFYLKSLQTLILDDNKFTGQVPEGVGSLVSLSVLSFKNNSFSGSLPDSLASLHTLRILALSGNNFSGVVPNLHKLSNLQVLDLESNNLGPDFPNVPKKLVSLVLRKNKFSLGVPKEVSSCYQLKKLDISSNELVGPFSPTILSLSSLSYLDISGNKLTGKLLKNVTCSQELSFVNLSSNYLTGDLPACLHSSSGSKIVLFSGNCLWNKEQWQHPYSFCQNEALAVSIEPHKKKVEGGHGKAVLASSMVGGFVGVVAITGLAFVVFRKEYAKQKASKAPQTRLILEKVSPAHTLKLLNDARYLSETRKLGLLGAPPYRTFVLDELREATNNFDISNLIGASSSGQIYKGRLTDGAVVAIRSIRMMKRHNVQSYTHQLGRISKIRYCHLVSTIGHCFECNQDDSSVSRICLVLEFVPNGTLRGVISEANSAQKLTWTQRMSAAIGIAKGIQFLHTGLVPGIFSNQLKITDILLDQNFHVKISKYNLRLLTENKKMDSGPFSSGSKGNNEQRLKYEEKDDVYDFGVILLEIISGRTINTKNDIDVSKDILIVSLTADEIARRNIIDPSVRKECSDGSLRTLMELCIRCLSGEPSQRPSVEDLIWNLQFAAQVQDPWNRDTYGNLESPAHV